MDGFPSASSMDGRDILEAFSSLSSFQCCVCLDCLYKPVVLACGHISCFWCVYQTMHGVQASNCAICRQQYNYFPSICQLLHLLLLKMEPEAYKLREEEVLEEEKILGRFSPQWVDHVIPEKVHAGKNSHGILDETENSANNLKAHSKIAVGGGILTEDGQMTETYRHVSVTDVQCAGCKELLFQPSVLNCGHVYCHSCMAGLVNGPPKCQVCQRIHPGQFPNVCLELDHFLEELFPKEYAIRREEMQSCKLQENSLDSASETQSLNLKACPAKDEKLQLNEDLSRTHVAVGCDSCGMYPIIGERYRCKDCKENVGFDLCEACYSSNSTLNGRFDQQHKPDHRFEIDDSRMICKLWMLEASQPEEAPEDLPDDHLENLQDLDSAPLTGSRNEGA